jgi:hypothetical protein
MGGFCGFDFVALSISVGMNSAVCVGNRVRMGGIAELLVFVFFVIFLVWVRSMQIILALVSFLVVVNVLVDSGHSLWFFFWDSLIP